MIELSLLRSVLVACVLRLTTTSYFVVNMGSAIDDPGLGPRLTKASPQSKTSGGWMLHRHRESTYMLKDQEIRTVIIRLDFVSHFGPAGYMVLSTSTKNDTVVRWFHNLQ